MRTTVKQTVKTQTFREQMARSMAELQTIVARGESPTGDGRLTVRSIQVTEPRQYDAEAIRMTRHRLNVSQPIFAQLLGVSPVLVRSWERGARIPAPIARRLLDQVRDDPARFLCLVRCV